VIVYDYPLNEKVRTLLRLEDLYGKAQLFAERTDSHDHHAALRAMFEILDVATRADLKSDLLQELERQRQSLDALRGNPTVEQPVLQDVLRGIERTAASLLASAGKFGQHLRDNEWMMGIKQRSSIPGGVCEFDVPSFHYWLHQDPEQRKRDLNAWFEPTYPIRDALRIVLKLLRESGKALSLVAYQGTFQQSPPQKLAQMLRVSLSESLRCVPEISANKYVLNVRFMTAAFAERPHLYDGDVKFDLTFCNL
jgi:cell division protein ZapD